MKTKLHHMLDAISTGAVIDAWGRGQFGAWPALADDYASMPHYLLTPAAVSVAARSWIGTASALIEAGGIPLPASDVVVEFDTPTSRGPMRTVAVVSAEEGGFNITYRFERGGRWHDDESILRPGPTKLDYKVPNKVSVTVDFENRACVVGKIVVSFLAALALCGARGVRVPAPATAPRADGRRPVPAHSLVHDVSPIGAPRPSASPAAMSSAMH